MEVTRVNLFCIAMAGATQSGEEEDWGQDGSWFLARTQQLSDLEWI